MLAYPIDEAHTLLDEKLNAAQISLSNCEEDLEFLREQITVSDTFLVLNVMDQWDLFVVLRGNMLTGISAGQSDT